MAPGTRHYELEDPQEHLRSTDRPKDDPGLIEVLQKARSSPSMSPVIRDAVRARLVQDWHEKRTMTEVRIRRSDWLNPQSAGLPSVHESTIDRGKYFGDWAVYNKSTILYWLQSAQFLYPRQPQPHEWDDDFLISYPRIISATVFEEWWRAYDYQPNWDYNHFVACPIAVKGKPTTLPSLLDVHRSLCALYIEKLSSLPKERRLSIFPLMRAVVLVLDEKGDAKKAQVYEEDKDGGIRLCHCAQHVTVLVALTGSNKGLSEPVSLDSLQPWALPLGNRDFVAGAANVVRVPLGVAVRFMVELEKRERLTERLGPPEPCHGVTVPAYGSDEDEQFYRADEYADAYLKFLDERGPLGLGNSDELWKAGRQARAALAGEKLLEDSGSVWFNPRFKPDI